MSCGCCSCLANGPDCTKCDCGAVEKCPHCSTREEYLVPMEVQEVVVVQQMQPLLPVVSRQRRDEDDWYGEVDIWRDFGGMG